MSTTIDNKVVSMQFDNQRFESNVAQTMSTLDKLKASLNFGSTAKNLKNFEANANKIDLSGIENRLNSLQKSFSILGTIGRTAIYNLTNSVLNFTKSFSYSLFRLTASGGISRAMNIEQARFQIQGLGKNWNRLHDDILYGVEDTAYGFDEAAKAAAVMAASGVDAGKEMQGALRGISGLAAMTGSSYTEVADIVGSIAGQGKLMTEQLRQFEHRGINVAAQLAKSMGKTEAEIRDMTTKGKISFEDFAKVMDDAWGAHAKDASKMFSGAASNIKASLSRIGAAFVEPAIAAVDAERNYTNLTDVFRTVIDTLKVFEDKLKNSDFLKKYMAVLEGVSKAAINFLQALTEEDIDKRNKKWDKFRKSVGLSKITFENIVNTIKGIGSAFNIVRRSIDALVKFLGPGFKFTLQGLLLITGAIGKAITKFDESIDKLQIFKDIWASLNRVSRSFGNIIKKLFNIEDFIKAVKSIKIEFKSAFNIVSDLFTGISKVIESIFKGISEVLSGNGFERLIQAFNTAFTGGILVVLTDNGKKIIEFLDNLKSTVRSGTDLTKNIAAMLDAVTETLSAMQNKLKAEALHRIAVAIAILAASLFILASIKPSKLMNALGGMAGLLAELSAVLFLINKMDFQQLDARKFAKIGTSLLLLSGAVLILSVAMTQIAKIKSDKIVQGIAGIGILMLEIIAFMKLSQKLSMANKGAVSLVIFAFALKILAGVVAELSAINLDQLANGLVGIGILLGALATFMYLTKGIKVNLKSMVGLILLGTAINIISMAVKQLSGLNEEELAKGLVAIGGILAEIAAFTRIIGKGGKTLIASVGILILTEALKRLTDVMYEISGLSVDSLTKALMTIALTLGEIAAAMWLMPKNMIIKAASLVLIANSLNILQKVLAGMGAMSNGAIAKSLGVLAGSLVILNLALNKMSLKGAVALIVISGALKLLGPVLLMLGKMSIKQVAVSLIALAGAFTILGLAARLVPAFSLMMLATAITMLGVAAFAVGAGLASFASGLLSIAHNSAQMLAGVPKLISIFKEFLIGLEDLVPVITGFGIKLIVGFLKGIRDSMGEVINVGADIIVKFLNGFSKKLPMVVDAAFEFIGELVKAIVAGIDKFAGKIQEGGKAIKAETFKMISDALLELSVAIFIMSKIPITGALTAIAGFAIFANGLGLLLVELGAISKIPGLKYFINEGGKLLGAIGSAIGQLVGGLIGGIGMGVTSAMVNMAENLSDFMKKLKPFLEGARSINPSTMTGVKAVAEVIMALTAAKLMDSLSKLPALGGLFGGGTFETLAKDINAFVPAFDSFAAAGEEITDDSIKGIQRVAKGAKAIIELSKEIPNQGGMAADVFGDNTLAQFAEGLGPFIEAFSSAAEASMDIKEDSIKRVRNVAKAATALINMAKEIPNQGGLVTLFTGDNNLLWFAQDLKEFGSGFSDLSSSVSEVTDAQIEKIKSVAKAAKTLADVASALPVVEAGFFETKVPVGLDVFAKSLGDFGTQFTTFATSVADLSDGDIKKASSVGKAAISLAEVAKSLPKEKKGLFSSEKTQGLGSFAKGLGGFAKNFRKFIDELKDLTSKQVDKINVLSKAISNLSKLGKLDAKGVTAINSLSGKLPDIGENVAGYANSLKDINAKGATSANKFLPTLFKVLKQSEGVKDIISGASLSSFGKGVKSYANSISGIKTKDLSSATSAVKKSLSNIKSAVKGANLADSFKHVGSNAGKALANAIGKHTNTAFKAAKNVANSGLKGAKAVSFKSAGENASEGYAQGVKNKAGLVYSAVEGVVKEAYKRGKKAQKSKSPSKLYAGLGEWAGEGYANGVYRTAGLIKKAVSSVIGEGSGTAKKMSMALSSILDSDDLSQPVIRPVMDLSDVKMGVQSMSSMLGSEYAVGLAGSIPVNSNGAVQSIRNSNVTTNVTNEFTINDVENGRQFVQEFSDVLGIEARRK